MEKLISMTDFVLEQDKKASLGGAYDKIVRYAKFLKQSLTLGMFVPCDENGNVLEEINEDYPNNVEYFEEIEQYNKAKKRCLFEGFECNYFDLGGAEITNKSSFEIINKDNIQICIYKSKPNYFIWNNTNGKEHPIIEDLIKYKPLLTPTSQKQLSL